MLTKIQNKTCSSSTLFLLFVQQTCQNIARTIEISSISLVHLMHGWGWAISQETEWCIKHGAIKTTENLLQSSK